MLWNGSTATDGLSDSANRGFAEAAAVNSELLGPSPSMMRWTRIGRAMFLTCRSPHVLERKVKFVMHLVPHRSADADPARLRQAFEARGHIDPVAKDIAAIPDYIADIDPHPELDPTIWRHTGVSLCQLALHFDRAVHRVDDAGKLDEEAVAGGLHDAAAVFLDFGIGQLPSQRLQSRKRPFLVGAHQPRIVRHIGGENGGQPAFDALRGHSGAPSRMGRIGYRLSAPILTLSAGADTLFRRDAKLVSHIGAGLTPCTRSTGG
jgi:hypothetical protein